MAWAQVTLPWGSNFEAETPVIMPLLYARHTPSKYQERLFTSVKVLEVMVRWSVNTARDGPSARAGRAKIRRAKRVRTAVFVQFFMGTPPEMVFCRIILCTLYNYRVIYLRRN